MKKLLILSLIIVCFSIDNALSQTTVVLQPGPESKDAKVHSYWPDRNLGDDAGLYAWAWTFYGGNPGAVRFFMEFDLGFLSRNAVILDARLSLYYYIGPEDPGVWQYGDNQAYIRRVLMPWDEEVITWNNQPSVSDQHAVWLPSSTSSNQDYTDTDISQLIQDIVSDPENSHGICVRLNTEEAYRALCFASGDNENAFLHPKLELTYIDCQTPAVSFNYTIQDQTVFFEPVCPSAESWLWDFGDGYLSTLQTPEHTYEQQGSYDVCLHVEDSCGAADYCETVDVCDRPVAGFSYHSEELTVYFSDTSYFADGCFWDFGDDYYSGQPSPWHTYDSSGYYYVCLKAWNDCGEDSICSVIFVDFSAVDDLDEIDFSVHPNPATGKITITSGLKDQALLEIYNLNGQGMFKRAVDFSGVESYPVDVSRFKPGIYILKLTNPRYTLTERIIILQYIPAKISLNENINLFVYPGFRFYPAKCANYDYSATRT